MLAVRHDAVTASLSPVVATLRDIEDRHGHTSVHGLVPGIVQDHTAGGWVPATALVVNEPTVALDTLLDAA